MPVTYLTYMFQNADLLTINEFTLNSLFNQLNTIYGPTRLPTTVKFGYSEVLGTNVFTSLYP